MKFSVSYSGFEEIRRSLEGFSERRLNAAIATALTRTAREIGQGWTAQIGARLDRPTPLTRRAVQVQRAEAAKLQATVGIRDTVARGIAPSEYLGTQEQGGTRGLKKFEQALQRQGSMPAGMRVVPGQGARLDSFGNISRGQIVQVISQLGTQFSPGYQRVIGATAAKRQAAAKRAGREYVAITQPIGGLKPGVYQRSGKRLVPIFWYVSTTSYRKRLSLMATAERDASVLLTRHLDQSIAQQIQRLRAARP